MKIPFSKSLVIAGISLFASAGAFAADDIHELKRRIEALEGRQPAAAADEADGPSVEIGGLVEVEGAYVDTKGSGGTSDLSLATLELGVEARVNPWLGARVTLLYEEGATEGDRVEVDEALVRMKSESSPLFLEAGRMTQAFGRFEKAMISDPMTLELGETKRHATVRAGYEKDGLTASVAAFKGGVQKTGDSDINSVVAALDWAREQDDARYGFGGSWTNNMAGTDGLQGDYRNKAGDRLGTADLVGGWSVNAMAGYGPVTIRGEYLAAASRFSDADTNGDAEGEGLSGLKPSAWNVEASYAFAIPVSLTLRYEGADDFGTNDRRYGATAGWDVTDGAALALEYQRGEHVGDSGNTDTVTVQLAMEF
jgi:hypothetical protein